MSTRRDIRKLAGAALAAAVLLGTGCGGDDGGDDETSAPVETQPLPAFIKQADRICAETNAEAEAGIRDALSAASAGDPDAITEAVEEITIPTLREQFERIGELPPPEGKEAEVEEILAEADEALAQVEETPDSLIVDEGRDAPFDEVSRLERELGLKVCGAAN